MGGSVRLAMGRVVHSELRVLVESITLPVLGGGFNLVLDNEIRVVREGEGELGMALLVSIWFVSF